MIADTKNRVLTKKTNLEFNIKRTLENGVEFYNQYNV